MSAQANSDGWKQRYVRWWSPSDWSLMQRAGLFEVTWTDPARDAQKILFNVRELRERSFALGTALGWVGALAFFWLLQ